MKNKTNSNFGKYFLKQRIAGILFILPSMIVLAVFVFFPLIMSFIYSTKTFNMMFTDTKFIGMHLEILYSIRFV